MTIRQMARRIIFSKLGIPVKMGNEVMDEIAALTNAEVEIKYTELKEQAEKAIKENITTLQEQLDTLNQ